MNRAEYRNAVRDLLALDIDVSALPADDATYGFDNIADALGTSPLLLESYVTAARKASRLAIGSPAIPPVTTTYAAPEDLTQDYHLRDLPLGTRGGLRVEEYFPVDAEYEIRVRLRRNAGGGIRGIVEEHQVELTLDGKRLGLFDVAAGKPQCGERRQNGRDEQMRVRLDGPGGPPHDRRGVRRQTTRASEQPTKPFLRSYVSANGQGLPDVDRVMITGPFEARARTTRPAGRGSSAAGRRRRPTSGRARARSCRGWDGWPIGGR